MSDDRLFEKRVVITKMASWLLIIPSSIIAILLVELFFRVFFPSIANSQGVSQWFERVIFFDGRDTIFQNHEDIFTYVPDSEIRNLNAFISGDDLKVAYDYRFRTNNFGLVQD